MPAEAWSAAPSENPPAPAAATGSTRGRTERPPADFTRQGSGPLLAAPLAVHHIRGGLVCPASRQRRPVMPRCMSASAPGLAASVPLGRSVHAGEDSRRRHLAARGGPERSPRVLRCQRTDWQHFVQALSCGSAGRESVESSTWSRAVRCGRLSHMVAARSRQVGLRLRIGENVGWD